MSRRPTKATASSRSNAATFSTGYERPPTSSHLDLSSANDDDTTIASGGSKIHKKSKQQLRQKGSSMLFATACCLISLCTVYYVVIQFTYMAKHHVNSSLAIHHEQKVEIPQDDENEPHNHLHHHLHLPPDSIYRTELTDIHNKPQSLLQYSGFISLIVNTACE